MALSEIVPFLATNQRLDVKSNTCKTILELTGSKEGILLVCKETSLLEALILLIQDSNSIAKDTLKAFVNISAEEEGTENLLSLKRCNLVEETLRVIQNKENIHADFGCAILANLSRFQSSCRNVFECLQKSQTKLEGIVNIFSQINYNTKGATLDLLAALIQNITQIHDGRREILNRSKCTFERLLPYTTYHKSKERRRSIVAALHNCCFEKEDHQWFLSEEIDIIPHLILPLAGPDVFSEEENNSLPIDLQFLPDDKEREEDPQIRALLLQSLMQLCTTRNCRELIREMNIYLILREHHKWEEDAKCKLLNEDLVNIIVRTEEEIGQDDLSSLEVPEDMSAKFTKLDQEFLNENK